MIYDNFVEEKEYNIPIVVEANLGPGLSLLSLPTYSYCYSTRWVFSILVCGLALLLSLGRGRVGKEKKIVTISDSLIGLTLGG
jgi:hypothetical protein